MLPPLPQGTYHKGPWYNWLLVPKILSRMRQADPHRTRTQRVAMAATCWPRAGACLSNSRMNWDSRWT
jgi:hypothetical protein